jgi:hypothetical protein
MKPGDLREYIIGFPASSAEIKNGEAVPPLPCTPLGRDA